MIWSFGPLMAALGRGRKQIVEEEGYI